MEIIYFRFIKRMAVYNSRRLAEYAFWGSGGVWLYPSEILSKMCIPADHVTEATIY
jgi:hypothetical protein